MPKYLFYLFAIKTSLFQLLLTCSDEAVDTTITHTGTHPSCTQLHLWLQLGAGSITTAPTPLSAPLPHVRHRGEVSGRLLAPVTAAPTCRSAGRLLDCSLEAGGWGQGEAGGGAEGMGHGVSRGRGSTVDFILWLPEHEH